jgi:hypothetical protein
LSEENGRLLSHEAPLRWGEVLRMEVIAKIENVETKLEHLDAMTVKHKDFMVWGAGYAVTIIGAVLTLWLLLSGKQDSALERMERGLTEIQEDVRANYRAAPRSRMSPRLEQPPTIPSMKNGGEQ